MADSVEKKKTSDSAASHIYMVATATLPTTKNGARDEGGLTTIKHYAV